MEEIFKAIKESAIKIKELIESEDSDYSEFENSTGDVQLELDIKSDIVIENAFKKIDAIKVIASEEKEEAEVLNPDGEYLIAYDPLDGSSLIDVNLSVGSIYGIYKESFDGKNLVASVYVVHGPRVEIIIATDKVRMYRIKGHEMVFLKEITLDERGAFNATGSTQSEWFPEHRAMIEAMFEEGYYLRYSGGMVPDLHQILLKRGGLFSYPATGDRPQGKLRLLFEVFPFAFVFEKAGGQAIDGVGRLLDLTPKHVHDTAPCFFGSNDEIKRVQAVYGRA
jgi:fructose-1,6-bisphosphatase I